jgi:uncharacterized protein (DUF849 family)
LKDPRGVLVKACLNGRRSREEHLAIPITPDDLAREARAAVAAGAGALHVHPRGPGGESLDPGACDAAVSAIRAACPGVPVGVTTGAWIAPDVERRLALIAAWTEQPDFASVNFFEEGSVQVCELLLERGVGVEAGLIGVEDARTLVAKGLADVCVRILVEVEAETTDAAVALAADIDEVLDRAGVTGACLHHGFGRQTWAVIEAGLARGRDIRIGLEDTLEHADGSPARDNADLVAAAVRMVESGGRSVMRPSV